MRVSQRNPLDQGKESKFILTKKLLDLGLPCLAVRKKILKGFFHLLTSELGDGNREAAMLVNPSIKVGTNAFGFCSFL